MAGKVRFYRGAQGTSLPPIQDGAIFIVQRGETGFGDMYVDINNATRLHIIPDSEFIVYNSSMLNTISSPGQLYLFQENNKTGVAVGDGSSHIGDLPVYTSIVKDVVRNKINAYLGTEYIAIDLNNRNKDVNGTKKLSDDITDAAETLVLSRELWLDF